MTVKRTNIWYGRLQGRQTVEILQIDLDIRRTFRQHALFRKRYGPGQQDLFSVLTATAAQNKQVTTLLERSVLFVLQVVSAAPHRVTCILLMNRDLFNLLYDQVGYCQGMSALAALLLIYLNCDQDAFHALNQLMLHTKYNMQAFYIPTFPKLKIYQLKLEKVSFQSCSNIQFIEFLIDNLLLFFSCA